MKLVILCGGEGTRIRDVTDRVPKPMLEIGGRPIVWHIMKLYACHGVTDFVLCLGYKGWLIKEFFLNFQAMTSDVTISLGRRDGVRFHHEIDEANWNVTLVDTGDTAQTGARVARVRRFVEGEDLFCLTYGDGLADLDVTALVEQHRQSGLIGTVSGVQVAGRWGELAIQGDRIERFQEKPARTVGFVSGGFMCFDGRRVWDYVEDRDDLVFEREPLSRMAADGQLGVYRHEGFWQSMDTQREYQALNRMWGSGNAPWKIWT